MKMPRANTNRKKFEEERESTQLPSPSPPSKNVFDPTLIDKNGARGKKRSCVVALEKKKALSES